uniref:Uncharacterized protein n=1 Tax=Siphoviridae sp. ctqPo10 TaxID=2827948 RepID=A0A8S5SVT1_9CAUD|nr:MAG TPA: hypothetical protein [Siphoviridae sp. ctqPo10]DAI19743.1 MAG TPA: hypothetical protein [Caudoviricetes sp.]
MDLFNVVKESFTMMWVALLLCNFVVSYRVIISLCDYI